MTPNSSRFYSSFINPIIFVTIFLILFSGLLLKIYNKREAEKTENIKFFSRNIAHRIEFKLKGNLDYLKLLAKERAEGLLKPESFNSKIDDYLNSHPEFINITWIDSEFSIKNVAPIMGNSHIIGLGIELPEPKKASRKAQKLEKAVYTNPFEAIQSSSSFEVWVPVFKGTEFMGLFAGVYSCDKLLNSCFGNEDYKNLQISLLDENSNVIALFPKKINQTNSISHSEDLNLLNLNLKIKFEVIDEASLSLFSVFLLLSTLIFVIGFSVSLFKLTEENRLRKYAQVKLEESKNYLDNIINGMGDPVFVKDDQSRFLLVNDAFCSIFNLSRAEILGKRLIEEAPKKEQESYLNIDDQVLLDGKESIHEEVLTVRDKDQIITSTRRTRIIYKHGRKLLIGVIRDISKLKRVERKLLESKLKVEESESKFRELFEKSGDAILINQNGIIVNFNQATVNLFEYQSKDQFISFHPSQLSPEFQPDGKSSFEKIEEVFNLAVINGTHRFEWMHKKSSGVDFLCEILLTLIKDEPNDRIFHAVVREITSYKKTEQELILAKEKAEESEVLKSAFLANMSHEIRTPMNSILGFSELLINEELTHEEKERYHKIVHNNGNRLMNIISDIVDISKIDAKQLTLNYSVFNLNKLVDDLHRQFEISPLRKKVLIKTSKGLIDTKSCIKSDSTRLEQVFSNLIENALKFTMEGFIEIGYRTSDSELQFFVKDSGIGINKKEQNLIFERFRQSENDYQKAKKGTGLGLSISKGIVNAFGGKIWVESEPHKGAVFYFTIPNCLLECIEENKSLNKPIEIVLKKTPIILIAEDEESNYWFLEAILENSFKLVHALNGKEAVDLFHSNEVDLVLMDMNMPIMNGIDATKEIRKTNKEIPIITLTAYVMSEDKEKALNAGCTSFLSKPVNRNQLLETINIHLKATLTV